MSDDHHIIVRPTGPARHDGILTWRGRGWRCTLGRSGIAAEKREGDGITPAGTFPFRRGFYRPDRVNRPEGSLEWSEINPLDGWSDDPTDPDYNRFIQHPANGTRPFSAEHLWREDQIYDLILVLGHNDAPPVPGSGSAIFMHLAREDYGPTEGCIALSHDDLWELLPYIGHDTVIDIRAD